MGIFLRHSYNIPPPRWGSDADVQYAIKVNAEKIYRVDPDKHIIIMPMFWGLPPINYNGLSKQGEPSSVLNKDGTLEFLGTSASYIDFGNVEEIKNQSKLTINVTINVSVYGSWDGIISQRNSVSDYTPTIELVLGAGLNQIAGRINGNVIDGLCHTPVDSIIVGKEHRIDMVYDGTGATDIDRLKIYIDSQDQVLVYSGTIPTTTGTPLGNMYIGGLHFSPYSYNFDGLMKEVKISKVSYFQDQISLFNDLPYGLYQKVARPFYLIPTAPPVGWTGEIIGITNPSEILGRATTGISKVNGIPYDYETFNVTDDGGEAFRVTDGGGEDFTVIKE